MLLFFFLSCCLSHVKLYMFASIEPRRSPPPTPPSSNPPPTPRPPFKVALNKKKEMINFVNGSWWETAKQKDHSRPLNQSVDTGNPSFKAFWLPSRFPVLSLINFPDYCHALSTSTLAGDTERRPIRPLWSRCSVAPLTLLSERWQHCSIYINSMRFLYIHSMCVSTRVNTTTILSTCE